MRVLSRDECLRNLRSHGIGRLGFVVRDQPLVFPVNYAMEGSHIVFRTDPGTKLGNVVGARAGRAGP